MEAVGAKPSRQSALNKMTIIIVEHFGRSPRQRPTNQPLE